MQRTVFPSVVCRKQSLGLLTVNLDFAGCKPQRPYLGRFRRVPVSKRIGKK